MQLIYLSHVPCDLITVGKIKEKYLRDAIAEYSKRLSRYCKLEIIEVADEKTPDHASDVVENTIRDKEAERIMKYVKEDAYVITLEINGKLLSSEELSAKIDSRDQGSFGCMCDFIECVACSEEDSAEEYILCSG